jgi:HEAT repeat protein
VDDDALRALRQLGAAAVPCLTNQLTLNDGPLQKSWVWIWPKLPAAIRGRFAQPVKAADLRAAAAWDLLHLGPSAKDAVPSLIAALKDDNLYVRLHAAASFGCIGPDAAPALSAIIEALKDRQWMVRFNAAYSLSLLGPLAKEAIPALRVALDDPVPEVRTKVKEALQKIGPAGAESAQ